MLEVHTFAKPDMKFKIKWGNCFTLHLLHIANYLHTCLLFEGKYFYGLWLWRPNWSISPELIPVSLAWREYFYSPVDGMLVHRRVTPSIKFAGTQFFTWVERGTVRIKCFGQQCLRPGLEPAPLALESSALTMLGHRTSYKHTVEVWYIISLSLSSSWPVVEVTDSQEETWSVAHSRPRGRASVVQYRNPTQFSEHAQSFRLLFSANHIRQIWQKVLKSTIRPTVHTNPSQKRKFRKRSSNQRNLKTLAFRFCAYGK